MKAILITRASGGLEKAVGRARRLLLSAMAIVWLVIDSAQAQTATANPFDHIRQINAGVLNVGYAEFGPADGPAVILLHGWPYDIHSYEQVAPLLAAKGYRVIVPYLRGYGTTRFLSDKTFRNGQQSVVAVDIIALMDALKIPKAIIGGRRFPLFYTKG